MRYIHPTTAISGLARCGLARCGTIGIVSQDPITTPVPLDEIIDLFVILGGRRMYTLKGTLNWSREAGSAVDSCSFDVAIPLSDTTPKTNESIIVAIGTMGNVLFRGYSQQVRELYSGGTEEEGNLRCHYQISGVGVGHILTRKYVNKTYYNGYAGTILRDVLSRNAGYGFSQNEETSKWDLVSLLKPGNIRSGKYYKKISFSKMTLMDICQKLADESDYIFYISNTSLHFVPESAMNIVDVDVTHYWEFIANWDFPVNNFHDLEYEEDGSQIVNVVTVHASEPRKYVTYYDTNDNWVPGITDQSIYHRLLSPPSSPGTWTDAKRELPLSSNSDQSSFSTHRSIYEVEKVELLLKRVIIPEESRSRDFILEFLRDPVEPLDEGESTSTGLDLPETSISRWNMRMPATYPGDRLPESGGDVITYYIKITANANSSSIYGTNAIPSLGVSFIHSEAISPIPAEERSYWQYIISNCDPWISREAQFSQTESEQLPLPDGVNEEDLGEAASGTLFPDESPTLYFFNIGYGGNSVEVNLPAKGDELLQGIIDRINNDFELYPATVAAINIEYTELVSKSYTFTDASSISACRNDGTDGAYVVHYEDRSLVGEDEAKIYAEGVFNNKAKPSKSASYGRYIKGLNITSTGVRPGERQRVKTRGHDETLTVESVQYSIEGGSRVPIFRMNVDLSKRPKSIANIMQKALQIKVG